MKKSNELLIGLFVCFTLAVLYWGVNFLKGENLFSQKRYFYAVYHNINGLTISRPVTINGFRVGQVSNITFSSQQQANLIVEIAIEEDIIFSKHSILEIYDSDIMGSKSLELKMVDGKQVAVSGDTLISSIASGLTSEVTEQFGSVKIGLDQLIISFDKVLKEVKNLSNNTNRILLNSEEKVANSIANVELISASIQSQSQTIQNLLLNILQVSDSLAAIEFVTLSKKILNVSNELESLVVKINQGEGSFSKLLNDDELYNELYNTVQNVETLSKNIMENPGKWFTISLRRSDKKEEK